MFSFDSHYSFYTIGTITDRVRFFLPMRPIESDENLPMQDIQSQQGETKDIPYKSHAQYPKSRRLEAFHLALIGPEPNNEALVYKPGTVY